MNRPFEVDLHEHGLVRLEVQNIVSLRSDSLHSEGLMSILHRLVPYIRRGPIPVLLKAQDPLHLVVAQGAELQGTKKRAQKGVDRKRKVGGKRYLLLLKLYLVQILQRKSQLLIKELGNTKE